MRYVQLRAGRDDRRGAAFHRADTGGTDDWHRRHQTEIATMVWAHPSIEHSYFKNADGEIHTVSPWRLPVFWKAVRETGLVELRREELRSLACAPSSSTPPDRFVSTPGPTRYCPDPTALWLQVSATRDLRLGPALLRRRLSDLRSGVAGT